MIQMYYLCLKNTLIIYTCLLYTSDAADEL